MSQDAAADNPVLQSLTALRRLTRPRAAAEQCDLCSADLAAEHQHLVEPATRQLQCACDACALLFSGGQDTKYRRVPRRTRFLADFRMPDEQWDGLLIPVGMAFFFYSSVEERVIAAYPSPAGATESLLTLESWTEVLSDNPLLAKMEPDVEALLVNRIGGARDYYLAPIDKCYELVGLMRANWRGLSGGKEVWQEIGDFFTRLKGGAVVIVAKRAEVVTDSPAASAESVDANA